MANLAGLEISGLINRKSQVFKKLAVNLTELDDRDVVPLIEDNPRIIIRPIISDGKRILFGFKEQDYLDFIEIG